MIKQLSVSCSATVHVCQACVTGLPPLVDDHRNREYTPELTQFIVPAYQFTCLGRVTAWAACVDPGGDSERYDIHFQVWRPANGGSCYLLIGSNVPPEPLAPVDHCVNFEVPLGQEIEVLPGDVMGFHVDRFHVPRKRRQLEDVADGGLQLDYRQTVSTLTLYSSAATVGSVLCRPPAGGLALLPVAAPVLSATVG